MTDKRIPLTVLNSIAERHPWVVGVYRDAIGQIHQAGFTAVLENETHNCIFARPAEVLSFFTALEAPEPSGLIWDVQNFWQMGTFPSIATYEMLKPFIRMIHLKGGRAETAGGALKWQSQLEDASWPVLPIVRRAIADGRSPVLCLNPPHGLAPSGFRYDPERDIGFLRNAVEEIE